MGRAHQPRYRPELPEQAAGQGQPEEDIEIVEQGTSQIGAGQLALSDDQHGAGEHLDRDPGNERHHEWEQVLPASAQLGKRPNPERGVHGGVNDISGEPSDQSWEEIGVLLSA